MAYECYQRCSICPKNVGHYCDECEIMIDRVLYEAQKLKVDCDHLRESNDVLRTKIDNDLIIPNVEKTEIGWLRIKLRQIRQAIIKKNEYISQLSNEVSEYEKIDDDLLRLYNEIKKLESLKNLDVTQKYQDIDFSMNTGILTEECNEIVYETSIGRLIEEYK